MATNPVVTALQGGLQYRQRMDDALRQAIEQTDLPRLVGRYYPDSGAAAGSKEDMFAVWRGEVRNYLRARDRRQLIVELAKFGSGRR